METCENCDKVLGDPETAIYDGDVEHWFCTYACRGKYRAKVSGDVPA